METSDHSTILKSKREFGTSSGSKCVTLVSFYSLPLQVSNNEISFIFFTTFSKEVKIMGTSGYKIERRLPVWYVIEPGTLVVRSDFREIHERQI